MVVVVVTRKRSTELEVPNDAYEKRGVVNAIATIYFDWHLPGTTKAANPKIFFNPVMPRMKGRKRSNFSLNSFKMMSIAKKANVRKYYFRVKVSDRYLDKLTNEHFLDFVLNCE